MNLISDGTQVLIDTGLNIVIYSSNRGKLRWLSKTGYRSPFTFFKGHIFCVDTLQNRVVELDPNNGQKVWSSDAISRPEITKILANADGIAVFNGMLQFVNTMTRKVVVADSDGSETMFDAESAKQSGERLFVTRSVTGGPIMQDVAEYNQHTGEKTWQSNAATGFWVYAGNLVVVENDNPAPPFYSYVPLTLQFRRSNIGPDIVPPGEAVFAPDPPYQISEGD